MARWGVGWGVCGSLGGRLGGVDCPWTQLISYLHIMLVSTFSSAVPASDGGEEVPDGVSVVSSKASSPPDTITGNGQQLIK